jgi:polyisoprenoid-binding protein YceI
MKTLGFALVTLALVAGCAKDPGKDQPQAQATAPAAAAAPVTGKTYTFGPADSKVEFTGAKVTMTHDGSFERFTGAVTVPEGQIEKGAVTVDIDVASLKIEPAKLQGHLQSKDFFDVATYPKATFSSTAIARRPDGKYDVTGNLDLHGVTKSITFPATIALVSDAVTASAEFSINRKDFAIVYPGMPDDLIKDNVRIRLTVKAPARS